MQTANPISTVGVRTLNNYINGGWVGSETSEHLPVTNPATGETIASVPMSTGAEVDRAARAAQEAYLSWRHVPPVERARYMYPLRDLLIKHRDELARLVTTENGKTLADAGASVGRAIDNVEVAAGAPSLMMGYGLENGADREIDEDAYRRPLGVFAAISPFNFPMMVPFWALPYAIATGNTFIVKPSEQVPMTQNLVFELMEELRLPPGVLNLVNGGKEAVNALLDHPLIKGISFVGSSAVAQHVYARGSASGKRVQAGGGAKNLVVVMPDAVEDKTISNLITSAFGSSGQRCLAGSVVVPVGDKAHERIRALLVNAMANLIVGNGLDPSVTMGPVISQTAKERILSAVQRGISEGAELLVGGQEAIVAGHEGGYFVEPTLFDNVRPEMSLAQEEIFGPVLAIMPARNLDEAIAYIDASPYGNGASIFTQHGGLAREFATRVDAGNIGINIGVPAPVAMFPFGGAKNSFFGTLHGQGRDAIEFFTDRRVIIRRWFVETGEERGTHW